MMLDSLFSTHMLTDVFSSLQIIRYVDFHGWGHALSDASCQALISHTHAEPNDGDRKLFVQVSALYSAAFILITSSPSIQSDSSE